MGIIAFLVLFPFVVALALLLIRNDRGRGVLVTAGSIVIAAASIYAAASFFSGGAAYFDVNEAYEPLSELIGYAMMAIEIALAVVIFVLGVRHRQPLACVLAAAQTPLMVWFELSEGEGIEIASALYIDQLSIIMALIIGIIGTLICVYALGYMKDFQRHSHGEPDRRPWFFFLLFLFLAAMYGIVFSNDLVWMFFFWEITTLCSFFLIGFTRTEEAVRNSFRALVMNLLGGLGFVGAIIYLGKNFGMLELGTILEFASQPEYKGYFTIPLALLAFAGITKAAQMPFNSWLLGAMVAPTPTSALLHSSTMVKAGVFLILKLSPAIGGTWTGTMTTLVGGITFLMASFAAVSQSNAKRVLAYSTVANLGLIVACAGTGLEGAVWAATMLIIFHAVTKSLLFLCVGTAEHNIGSRDIEDMDGLFGRMPRLAAFMITGISAMYLAPFGMLLSKWAALESLILASNPLIVLLVIFGSSVTLFYWGKWLGKMAAIVGGQENIQGRVHVEEWASLGALVALVAAACLSFPTLSNRVVVPYIMDAFAASGSGDVLEKTLSNDNMVIMSVMVAIIILLPLLFYGRTNRKIVPIYLSGAGLDDGRSYTGSMQKKTEFKLRNWYMETYFAERRMNAIGVVATCAVLAFILAMVLGGVIAS
ncbi:MAG: NADH-quinone oxidoreductase subunit L [Clostridiales Family XIII bacterium]|nr:NADH-quinone oxidoreductase subunit L [Clostridiales Family XIII bacterium]